MEGIQKTIKWATKKGEIPSYILGCWWELRNVIGWVYHALDWTKPWTSASLPPLQFKALGIPVSQVLPFTGMFSPCWVQTRNSCLLLHVRAVPSSWPKQNMTLAPWVYPIRGLQCANDCALHGWLLLHGASPEDSGWQQPTGVLHSLASFLKENTAQRDTGIGFQMCFSVAAPRHMLDPVPLLSALRRVR